jgi:hypothetical protein
MSFELILDEVEHLHSCSSRLEGLAENNLSVSEALVTIAGQVRGTATILAVLIAMRKPHPA